MRRRLINFLKKKVSKLIWVVFLLACVFVYKNYANDLPRGIHVWAQSDRYALAKNYQDNLNFFVPKTQNVMSEEGKVGTEFPVVQYIAAQISNLVLRDKLPFIHRLLNFLTLILGCFVLARALPSRTFYSSLLVIIAFVSPVVLFYAFNFNPDTAGLGLSLIGLSFFYKYIKKPENKNLYLCLIFAGFATLVKTSCGLFLAAFGGVFFFNAIINKDYKTSIKTILSLVILGLIIVSYDYFFFHRLNKMYSSYVFMSASQPLATMEDLKELRHSFKFWFGQYLTFPQLIVLGVSGILMIGYRKSLYFNKLLWALIGIFLLGVLAFVYLMGKQYSAHDYYFITSIIPLFLLLQLGMWSSFSHLLPARRAGGVVMLSMSILSFTFAATEYPKRMSEVYTWKNHNILNEVDWMRQGAETMDRLKIDTDENIFVLYAFAPNTSLIYFNRKGKIFNHEEMQRSPDNIEFWLNRIHPGYIVVPTIWSPHLERDQPAFLQKLYLFHKNDDFLIYKVDYDGY
jgi:hypothetical protein